MSVGPNESVHVRKKAKIEPRNWACPVCLDELNIDDGVVPMVLSCGSYVVHSLCWTCERALDKKMCPGCNQPYDNPRPWLVLVDERRDEETRKIVAQIKHKDAQSALQADVALARVINGAKAAVSARTQRRVELVVKRVMKSIDEGSAAKFNGAWQSFVSSFVPEFDKNAVRLTCAPNSHFKHRTTRVKLGRELRAMAVSLTVPVNEILLGTGFRVCLDRPQVYNPKKRNSKFVYLRYRVKKIR